LHRGPRARVVLAVLVLWEAPPGSLLRDSERPARSRVWKRSRLRLDLVHQPP
jgi:hypothetical protein